MDDTYSSIVRLKLFAKTVRAIGLSGYHRFMGQYALASERLSEAIESAANHCCAELRLAYDHEYKEISKTR